MSFIEVNALYVTAMWFDDLMCGKRTVADVQKVIAVEERLNLLHSPIYVQAYKQALAKYQKRQEQAC